MPDYKPVMADENGRFPDRVEQRLSATIGSPALAGEQGVINTKYEPGDLRRYGIFPDGTTNWYVDHRAKWDAAQANSATLGLCLFFPSGYYASGFEFTVSDVSARFEQGAEIGGIIHVISYDADPVANPVRNISWEGTAVTYDRFGTVHVDGLTFDRIHVKFDGTKNVQDPGHGRGVHIYSGSKNFTGHEIVVDNVDAAGSNNDAAVAIDNYPENMNIGRIYVKASEIHGAYVTGQGHQIGEIQVDEFGSGAYAGSGLVGSNGLAQSQQLAGVWLNRCEGGRIGRIAVNQGAGSRPNALYDVLIEETGHWEGGSFVKGAFTIDHIDALNVAGSSRGVSFGDTLYAAGDVIVNSRSIRAKVAASKPVIAGAGAVSLNEKAQVTCDALTLDLGDFDGVYLKDATAKLSARLIDCGTHKYRGLYAMGKATVAEIRSYRISSGGGVSTVELAPGSEFSHLGALRLEGNAKHPARGLYVTAADCTVDDVYAAASNTGGGAIALSSAPRTRLGTFKAEGPGSTGTGLNVANSADVYLGPGSVSGFGTGATASGTVSGSAVAVKVSGNTSNTSVPAATFTELGCTGLQLA